MAYARIANTYDMLGELTLAKENIRKAYDLRQRTSDWESWYIEGHYYGIVTGEVEKAGSRYTNSGRRPTRVGMDPITTCPRYMRLLADMMSHWNRRAKRRTLTSKTTTPLSRSPTSISTA
jgi:hypothetical protein